MENCLKQWGLRGHHDERRERRGRLHPGSSGFERGTCGHRHIQLKFLSTYCAVPPQYLRELPTNLDAVEREPSCADCIHPEHIRSWRHIHFRRPLVRRDGRQEQPSPCELEHSGHDLAADGWRSEFSIRRPRCDRDRGGDQSQRHHHILGRHRSRFEPDDGDDRQRSSRHPLVRDMPDLSPRRSQQVCELLQPRYESETAASTAPAAVTAQTSAS